MLTVKVVYETTGKAAAGRKVSVQKRSIFDRGLLTEYTNSNGEAHFELDPCDGEVFVDGSSEYSGRLSGRTIVYL